MQECGGRGNPCCPGASPCKDDGVVCANFNGEGPAECATCARAQFALNYAPNSPLREQCEAQNGDGGGDGAQPPVHLYCACLLTPE